MFSLHLSDAMSCEDIQGSVHPGHGKVQRRGKIVGNDRAGQQTQEPRALGRS